MRLEVALQRHGGRVRRNLAEALADLQPIMDQLERGRFSAAKDGKSRVAQLGKTRHRTVAQGGERLG